MTVDLNPVRIRGLMATTRSIPDRDHAFAESALRQFVEGFTPGRKLHREHTSQVIGRVLSVELVNAIDNGLELWAEAEVDLPVGEDLHTYAGRAFSVAVLEHDDTFEGDEVLVVGADSIAFSDEHRAHLRDRLSRFTHVYVGRYHQFAAVPKPAIVLDIRDEMVLNPPASGDDLRIELIKGLAELAGQADTSAASVVIRVDRPGRERVEVEVPVDAVAAERMLRGVLGDTVAGQAERIDG